MKSGLKPWPKGVSGNPEGRRVKPMVDKMIEQALLANDSATAKVIANKLISMATHGSLAAIKLIAERSEGRPKSSNDAQEKAEAKLTKEQIQARLTELLSTSPEVREDFVKLISNQDKVN